MQRFDAEFRTLEYVITQAKRILLVAHNRPDPDTVGANLALEEYLRSRGKHVDIACFNPFPDTLKGLCEATFFHPDQLDLPSYDAVIASDSVDRGFDAIVDRFTENQVIVLIDHHPDIDIRYRNVTITLTTHDTGGITGHDIDLAARIEAMSALYTAPSP